MLRHRRDVVLDVRLDRRELHVRLLGDCAGLGDFDRHSRYAADLVLRHDRAAGEAPDAAVDDANAKATRAPVGVHGDSLHSTATATSSTTTAAAPATTTARAAGAATATSGVEVRRGARKRRRQRKADVSVRRAGHLRFGQYDVGHSLEARLEDATFGRRRQDVADQVTR